MVPGSRGVETIRLGGEGTRDTLALAHRPDSE
jgi:hypothetical protein